MMPVRSIHAWGQRQAVAIFLQGGDQNLPAVEGLLIVKLVGLELVYEQVASDLPEDLVPGFAGPRDPVDVENPILVSRR